jgi:mannose-6-phosphate isomerase-like protein (cupin superfamily)
MPFIVPDDRPRAILIGPDHGARTIFRARERYEAGFFVGLHFHHGDESFEVRSGRVRFVAGNEQRVCDPGTIIFVPAGVRHGFVAETEATVDVFSQQQMGLYVVVIDPDGTEREEEIFMEGFPSSHTPPAGEAYTPRARIRAMYATTRHLLGDVTGP